MRIRDRNNSNPESGMEKIQIRDGKNLDPQHCLETKAHLGLMPLWKLLRGLVLLLVPFVCFTVLDVVGVVGVEAGGGGCAAAAVAVVGVSK
jgi:hypothetical protein